MTKNTGVQRSQRPELPKRSKLSGYMTVVLIYITHGFVNTFLLGPWNPIRCAYWNRQVCNEDEAWIMNWFAFGSFHLYLLLSMLGYRANGKVLLEQRLVQLCATIMLSNISSGIFMIDQLNKPIAAVQLVVFFGLLLTITYITATTSAFSPLPTELRSSSFDSRRKLPISSVSLVCLFLLSAVRLLDMTFGTGQESYKGDRSGLVYQNISNAATSQLMWCTIILGHSVFLANSEQQKSLLTGHVVALFTTLCILAGEQGQQIESSQLRLGGLATLSAIVLGLLGII